jgi:hypothetical protein
VSFGREAVRRRACEMRVGGGGLYVPGHGDFEQDMVSVWVGWVGFLLPEGEGIVFGCHSGTTRAEVGFWNEDVFVIEADDVRGVVWVVGAR